jgi:Flp pilus assembly protein TadG
MLRFRRCEPVQPSTREDRRGVAAVEMALVLPVFVLSMLGVIEIGRAMMLTQVLENAARTGVRMAVLNNTTNAQVTTAVQTFVHDTTNVASGNVTVTIGVNGNNSASLATAQPGDTISVTVSVPFTTASWVPPSYLGGKNIIALCTMPHE